MRTKQGNDVKPYNVQDNVTSISVVRDLQLEDIRFIFEGCTREELAYFLQRATDQEEYELCRHFYKVLSEDLLSKM
jgi:hypothetical protein